MFLVFLRFTCDNLSTDVKMVEKDVGKKIKNKMAYFR